jgi:hypothetical protein
MMVAYAQAVHKDDAAVAKRRRDLFWARSKSHLLGGVASEDDESVKKMYRASDGAWRGRGRSLGENGAVIKLRLRGITRTDANMTPVKSRKVIILKPKHEL